MSIVCVLQVLGMIQRVKERCKLREVEDSCVFEVDRWCY